MTLIEKQLRFLVVVLLILGLFFRFANIDKKFYWYDEVFTSLRISGYTQIEVLHEISSGQLVAAKDLMKYQRLNQTKNWGDTIKSLAIEEPQLPPLYFLAVKYWAKLFGDSPAATRSFSVWMSLLAFPGLYWLCRELFAPPEVAWIVVGLLAVSPLHDVLYAQEARPYSLWSALILLSCASLLRAMRLQTKLSWSIYVVVNILGIYTHLFSLLVAFGHGIYLVGSQGFTLNKKRVDYSIATAVSLLGFLPWIGVLLANKRAAAGAINWADLENNRLSLVKNLVGNIGRIFWDFGLTSNAKSVYLIALVAESLMLLVIVGYAVYFLCSETNKQVWLFVLTMAVTALAVVLPDVILGGIRSTKARYLFPTYLGMQIAVAYLLATKIRRLCQAGNGKYGLF